MMPRGEHEGAGAVVMMPRGQHRRGRASGADDGGGGVDCDRPSRRSPLPVRDWPPLPTAVAAFVSTCSPWLPLLTSFHRSSSRPARLGCYCSPPFTAPRLGLLALVAIAHLPSPLLVSA